MDKEKTANEKSKKPVKPWVRAVLAAVAAVCLVGAIIGIVFIVKAAVNAVTGYGGDRVVGEAKQEPPIKLVEDRLYFTFDGQKTDITNEVDRDLPYIYPYEDPETHMPVYIIAGGNREQYAYAEVVQQEDGSWQGRGYVPDDMSWYIGVSISEYEEPFLTYAYGWYHLNETVSVVLNYNRSVLHDDGSYESVSHVHYRYDIPRTWEEDCVDAWLIRGLLDLELFELPDIDFSLADPIEVTEEGRVIFVAEGQNTDITEIINEGTPYIYKVKYDEKFGEDYDSYILVGGPTDNCGWVLLSRYKNDMWIGVEENITFINEALSEGEPGYETFRQWYLNGVEQIGYNKGTILMNRTR